MRGRVWAGVAVAGAGALTTLTVAHATQFDGIPRYQHVGVLVLENESESATWDPTGDARYLNSLVARGAFAPNYYADGHVSLDNYITMTSGQPGNPDTDSDCLSSNLHLCQQTVNTPVYGTGANIADQVEGAHLTWREYADSAPAPCFHAGESPAASPPDPYQGDSSAAPAGNYADRHDPFVYYDGIVGSAARCANDVPFTALASDLNTNRLPGYFFITPDTCHDGHDSPCASGTPQIPCMAGGAPSAQSVAGGLSSADCWLQATLPALLAYLDAHDGVLFITTDEGSSSDTSGCCTGGPGGAQGFGGRVGLLALGPGVRAGEAVTTSYDHASLLRTTEDALGIGTYLNNAATASAMGDLFAQPGPQTPEAPLAAVLPLAGLAALALVWRRRTAP